MQLKKVTDKSATIVDAAYKDCMHGDDLRGKEHVVTFEGFYEGEFYEQSAKAKVPKMVIKFVEPGYKPLIMNNRKTNQLKAIFPTHRFDLLGLIGKKVTVYAVDEKHFGQIIPVLQFKAAKETKPVLTPESEKWKGAAEGLVNATVTLEQIKKYYTLSKANEKLLNEEAEVLRSKKMNTKKK